MTRQAYNFQQRMIRRRMKTGERTISAPAEASEATSVERVAAPSPLAVASAPVSGESQSALDRLQNWAENDDPERRRFWIFKPPKIWFRKFIHAYRKFYPKLTKELLEERELLRRQEEIRRNVSADSRALSKLLVHGFTHMGIGHDRDTTHKKFDHVWLDKAMYSEDGRVIYFHVAHIPGMRGPDDMTRPEVSNYLSYAIRHPVHINFDPAAGGNVTIAVERAGKNDLPDMCLFRELVKKIPISAPPMTYMWGVSKNGGLEWTRLDSHPHLLGAGTVGGGKSIFVHSMLCTLITRNNANNLRLLLIDLKAGVELGQYAGIPHLINDIEPSRIHKRMGNSRSAEEPENDEGDNADLEPDSKIRKGTIFLPGSTTGIASDIRSAASFLKWTKEEIDRRNKLFTNDPTHPRKLEEYNHHHRKNKLPHIVVMIDELGSAMDKSIAIDRTEEELIKFCRTMILTILRLGRSNGVSMCAFTQSLDNRSSGVGVAFKTNASMRVCFSFPDATSSILVLGDGSAVNLHPAGRAICKNNATELLVQTPYITASDINEAIMIANSGQQNVAFTSRLVTPEEIIRWCINDNEMSLRHRDVAHRYTGILGWDSIETILNQMDDNEYEVDGDRYRVIPGMGTRQRRVIRLDQE